MLEFLKALFLVRHFFYYMLITFLIMLSNSAIYADETALYFMCDQASDLWQQLELASQLEFGLWDTVDWGRNWLFDFSAGNTQLVSFDWSSSTGVINVKMDGSALE